MSSFVDTTFGPQSKFAGRLAIFVVGVGIVASTFLFVGVTLAKSHPTLSTVLTSVGASAIGGLFVDIAARVISRI